MPTVEGRTSFDISGIPNKSKTFPSGMTRAQIIHLWTGKEPFIAYRYMVLNGPLEGHESIAQLIDWMHGYIDGHIRSGEVGTFYGSLAGFVIRTPDEEFRYLRPHIEAQIERGIFFPLSAPVGDSLSAVGTQAEPSAPRGRPRKGSHSAAGWDSVDWSLSNAEISRKKGVSRQAASAARKRHAPDTTSANENKSATNATNKNEE